MCRSQSQFRSATRLGCGGIVRWECCMTWIIPDKGNRPLFFAARLQHGVLRVPSREELSQRMGVAP